MDEADPTDRGRIFVAGSLHLDVVVDAPRLPALDETVTGSGVQFVCGGKGCNQAVAAALHGAPVSMAGRVGDDMFGERLLEHLDTVGVERSGVQVASGSSSGMSVAIVDADGEYGAVIVSAANLDVDPALIEVPRDARIVVLQNEIPERVNVAVAERARGIGAQVLLNAAPWRPASDRLLALVDLLVVNRVEAAAMVGREHLSREQLAEVLGRLPASGAALVATLGADGALYADRSGERHVEPGFAVQVVSTHGAGDTFVGSLAARLTAGDAVAAALRYAAAAAAAHVATPVLQRLAIGPTEARALIDAA
jgi:ribokinase